MLAFILLFMLMLLLALSGLIGLFCCLLCVLRRVWSWLRSGPTKSAINVPAAEREPLCQNESTDEREPRSWLRSGSTEGAINVPTAEYVPMCLVVAINESAAEREPWCLHPYKLELWYKENIQRGTTDFDTDCREAVDTVVRYLHRDCSTNIFLFDVSKVIKGGSLGKGTMVKDLSDVDLVAFINPPHMTSLGSTDPQVYRNNLKAVLEQLEAALRRHPWVRFNRSDAYLVNFAVEVRSAASDPRWVDVDLLPTADNISGSTLGSLFRKMLQMRGYDRGFYSASLVKFQREFVKNLPAYVKDLIRLVKYWAYTCLPPALRKSYPLELITIHRWEEAGRPSRFKKAQGLRDVLQTLTDLNQLKIYWMEHYDGVLAELSIEKLGLTNPIVLDPANPTNNVCSVYHSFDNREKLQDAAGKTLQSALLRDVKITTYWGGSYEGGIRIDDDTFSSTFIL